MSKLAASVRQWLTRYETDLEVKQLLTQALTKCETDPEVKLLLAQVNESCAKTLSQLRKMPQTKYVAEETYEIHRRRKFTKDVAEIDLRRAYVKLLRSLDRESICTVNTILARTKALSATNLTELDLFS